MSNSFNLKISSRILGIFLKRRVGLLQQKSQAGTGGCHNPFFYLVDSVHRKYLQCSTQKVQFCHECNSRLRNQQLWLCSRNFFTALQVHMGLSGEPPKGAIWTVYRTESRFSHIPKVSLQEKEFDTFSCFKKCSFEHCSSGSALLFRASTDNTHWPNYWPGLDVKKITF